MDTEQNTCKRCGTCCSKGGPALHTADLRLVREGLLPLSRLITIRKGELVFKPHEDAPQLALCELVKISGTGKEWQCFYFDDETKGCMMYQDRPLSCRELQCWDTGAVEDLVEKDTLDRFDIVSENEPIYSLIREHESRCPCPDMEALLKALLEKNLPPLEPLEELTNEDIRLRRKAVQEIDITLAEELFYFGRPIFQLLQQLGVKVREENGMLKLRWPA
ncbi:MAG: YkgJ family cysteine cluster protein [Desulfopila sp.]|jgi:Fe-S-cluster containining protein|nr:YkgJ family cysteine cluster protein [Desulfopila sp.]